MKLFLFLSMIFFTANLTSVYAGEISLPAKNPPVASTDVKSLGTLDENIGLEPGVIVKDFVIDDHMGQPTSFKDLKEHAPLLVIFYRGGWCPYCNTQIRELTLNYPKFEKRGYKPVLISADKVDAASIASRTYNIPFPVLSDPNLIAHDIFNVTMKLDEGLISKYKEYGIILKDWNGKGHNKFAVSSAFIVNKNGKVEWSHSDRDYKTRPSPEQLISVIDSLSEKNSK